MALPKYYKSIDELPVLNYWKIMSTGSMEWLIVSGQPLQTELLKAWDNIEEELLDIYAADKDYINQIQKEKLYYLNKIETALNPTAHNKITLAIEDRQREEQKDSKPFDFYRSVALLSKFMGYNIQPEVISTRMYYANLYLLKESTK